MNQSLAKLDKDWLRGIISSQKRNQDEVSGALASEALSDSLVVVNGTLTTAFAAGSLSLVPLAQDPVTMIQLGLAYLAIRSLYDQRNKVGNDIHVLEAILEVDEATPGNMTAMLHDYIEIHAAPDENSHPSQLEIRKIDRRALATIIKNFKRREGHTTVGQKISGSAGFLKKEFKNATVMMGQTIMRPKELYSAFRVAAGNLKLLHERRAIIIENSQSETLLELYRRLLKRAKREDERVAGEYKFPERVRNLFPEERMDQLRYLHQQQASLRTVSRLRIETAQGFMASAGIIGLAIMQTATASTAYGVIAGLYTVVASLPSLKILSRELDNLTQTNLQYGPKVDRAAANFIAGIGKASPVSSLESRSP